MYGGKTAADPNESRKVSQQGGSGIWDYVFALLLTSCDLEQASSTPSKSVSLSVRWRGRK